MAFASALVIKGTCRSANEICAKSTAKRSAAATRSADIATRQRAGGNPRGIFAEAVSSYESCRRKPLRFQRAQRRYRDSQNRRLSVLSQLQLLVRTIETKVRKRETQRRICF